MPRTPLCCCKAWLVAQQEEKDQEIMLQARRAGLKQLEGLGSGAEGDLVPVARHVSGREENAHALQLQVGARV